MTLIEAVKSGRPFKRPSEEKYWKLSPSGFIWNEYVYLSTNYEYITASDYELEPRKITEELVRQSLDLAIRRSGVGGRLFELENELIKELFR